MDVNKGGDGPGIGTEQGWGQGHSRRLCQGGQGVTLGDRVGDTGATGATHRSKRRFCRSSKQ